MEQTSIPIMVPALPSYRKLESYLKRIDENRIYSNFGPLNQELIEKLSDYFGISSENIVTVANATLGIQGALATTPKADFNNWQLPSWTFAATPSAACLSKIDFEFIDVDHDWRCLPTSNVVNLIDVLPFGERENLTRMNTGIQTLVIDGAASFDALKGIDLDLSFDCAIIISMHATKLLAAGEGGVFLTNNPEWAKKFKRWTNFGFDSNRQSESLGTNAKLSEYSAAIALATLDDWDNHRSKILMNNETAKGITKKLGFEVSSAMESGYATPYWIIKGLPSELKKSIEKNCAEKNIQTRDWWGKGCHKMKAFAHINYTNLDNTERIANSSVGLPFHTNLKESDWIRISNVLESSLDNL